MPRAFDGIHPLIFLLIATVLEVSGDAVVRMGIYNHGGAVRLAWFVAGATLLFGYGLFLNLAPLEFGQLVGLYIATLFVVWQLINYVAFRTAPTLPIVLGGTLIIVGGVITTFWKPA
ncbi:MAG TPA: hypothetical protein VHW25_05315 [Steroidobacteraceae bacterium]|jgi:small multidrug resistance family-3 protein|nr:hypothetical protein [Steroidobacteraceae bacterium]